MFYKLLSITNSKCKDDKSFLYKFEHEKSDQTLIK